MNYLRTTTFNSKVRVIAPMNEDSKHRAYMGMDAGCPDLIILIEGKGVMFLELKTKKGKLSASQKKWNDEFDAHYKSKHCTRAVAYGYDEAVEIINSALTDAPN